MTGIIINNVASLYIHTYIHIVTSCASYSFYIRTYLKADLRIALKSRISASNMEICQYSKDAKLKIIARLNSRVPAASINYRRTIRMTNRYAHSSPNNKPKFITNPSRASKVESRNAASGRILSLTHQTTRHASASGSAHARLISLELRHSPINFDHTNGGGPRTKGRDSTRRTSRWRSRRVGGTVGISARRGGAGKRTRVRARMKCMWLRAAVAVRLLLVCDWWSVSAVRPVAVCLS